MKYKYRWEVVIYEGDSDDGDVPIHSLEMRLDSPIKLVERFLESEVGSGLIGMAHYIKTMEQRRKKVIPNDGYPGNAIIVDVFDEMTRLTDFFSKEVCEIETLELYALMAVWSSGTYLYYERGYTIDQLP